MFTFKYQLLVQIRKLTSKKVKIYTYMFSLQILAYGDQILFVIRNDVRFLSSLIFCFLFMRFNIRFVSNLLFFFVTLDQTANRNSSEGGASATTPSGPRINIGEGKNCVI